jgi:hypothetical protein
VSEDAGIEPRTVGTLVTSPNLAHTVVPIAAHFLSTLHALISREQIGLFTTRASRKTAYYSIEGKPEFKSHTVFHKFCRFYPYFEITGKTSELMGDGGGEGISL